MARYPLAAVAGLLAMLLSSRPVVVDGQTTWQIAPESLRSPAAANSAQPQLAVFDRGVLLSWVERAGHYLRAAMARGELVFAWTESADGGARQVRTAAAPLPAAGATAR